MQNEQIKKLDGNKLKFIFLLAYFLILTVERIISLTICCMGEFKSFDFLDYYMIMLTIFALFCSYIFTVLRCTDIIKKRSDNFNIFSELAIAAGMLLLGGMVHTDGSIPVMQFISYGMILAAMGIHTAQSVKKSKDGVRRWLAFSYTVAYSMAIPVVYHTNIELANVFIPIECVVSVGMVTAFTVMLTRFFEKDGENNFSPLFFILALVGDLAVLILRWEEEINMFVLIFLCVTTALWLSGSILKLVKKK